MTKGTNWTRADLADLDARTGQDNLKQVFGGEKGRSDATGQETKPKPSKYHNIKTDAGGITFDSKKEAKRYYELKMLEWAGNISDLKLQEVFEIRVNKELICKYKADFSYVVEENGFMKKIVEDVKGIKTPVYRLKKKLMAVVWGITIIEV